MKQHKEMDTARTRRLRSYAEAILGDTASSREPADLIFTSEEGQEDLMLERTVRA